MGAVWVLDTALVFVSEVVIAKVAAVVGGDVAAITGSSGCEWRGLGVSRNVVAWLGSEFRRTRVAGGRFEAGKEVVVVVVDVVGVVDGADGGCASVVSGDVAGDGEGRGVGMVQLGFG
jgi:hypothetical protein